MSQGRFFSMSIHGSIEAGTFESVNDVYIKYSVVTGPDWVVSSGQEVGITQISRYRVNEYGARIFIWNQPITIGYRSYNFYGWPQIVFSVYYYDAFGNDQILGYGSCHLPVTSRTLSNYEQSIVIYAPQSSSLLKQILSRILGRRPELVDSNLFARGDCRSVLQMVSTGNLSILINTSTKDVANNGFRCE